MKKGRDVAVGQGGFLFCEGAREEREAMELDEWEPSAEELESLEKDALRQLSQRSASSSSCSSSSSPSSSSFSPHCHSQQQERLQRPEFGLTSRPSVPRRHHHKKPLGNSFPGHTPLPKTLPSKLCDGHSKELPKLTVHFFLHASGDVAAKFPYNPALVAAFRSVPKASWSARERLWIFPISSLSSAEQVLGDITQFNVEVENFDPMVQRAIAAASAVPDLRDLYDRVPYEIESKLLPFQRDGVRFVLQHGGRALLADEMGLGKTLQAIAVATCVRDAWPVLVLAPSSLRLQWAAMLQQWLDIPASDILVVLSQRNGSNKSGFKMVQPNAKGTVCLDGTFNIISYDVVSKLQSTLLASEFKVVIADESHFLKNAQAKRTIAALPVIQKAQFALLLSGTPALSRPIELFKQLEALYPDVYKNIHEYGNRYCKGGVFGLYQGASNHEELHNLMKATVMIRRLKKDVLLELPEKRRQQVFLDLGEKEMAPINSLFSELEIIKKKITACQSEEEVGSLKFEQKRIINKMYNDSGEAKIPAVLDYLATIIEAGCKFLVFAYHIPMIDSICEFLLTKKVGCIRIDGKTPQDSRQSLVTGFQENDAIRAAVLSIKVAATGLTLTAATTIIFAELCWTPGDLRQAESRAHRIGQASSVNVYYLLANDTIDDIIWDVVQSKLDNIGQMLDGEENTMEVSSIETTSSLAKQRTLDSFMKRCENIESSECQPKFKSPRH